VILSKENVVEFHTTYFSERPKKKTIWTEESRVIKARRNRNLGKRKREDDETRGSGSMSTYYCYIRSHTMILIGMLAVFVSNSECHSTSPLIQLPRAYRFRCS
jgi:hypothetical protein